MGDGKAFRFIIPKSMGEVSKKETFEARGLLG